MASAEDVFPYSTLTVAVPFEPGTVTQRVRPDDSWIVQVAPKAIAGLIGLLIVAGFVIRATLWRSPKPGLVIAQYDPPEGQHVLLSAELIGNQFRGLPAQFIDFAVRGMIRIIDNAPGAPDLERQEPLRTRVRDRRRCLGEGTARAHDPVRCESRSQASR